MNKNLLIGAALVLVVAIVGVVMFKNKKTVPEANAASSVIQISAGQAYIINEDGSRSKELKNDEPVTAPVTIEVTEGGSANISFPDGSVARIQSGTMFTLKSASYDAATGKANTSIFVKAGRVWSKVMELATPESTWEVETQTAVATVRGTAFDTNVNADMTVFAGSERNVSVSPIDPATHMRVESAAQTMGEGKMIQIQNNALADIIAGKINLTVADLLQTERDSDWFRNNEEQDTIINTLIDALRASGLSGTQLQSEIRLKLREQVGEESNESEATDQNGRGTLIDLIKSGKSQKCTFSFDYGQGVSAGTVYLADNKMRGDFKTTVTAEGANMTVENHIIRNDDFTYVWTSASPQGFKIQTTGEIGSLGDQSFDYNQMLDYRCSNWSADSSTFSLPSGVTFSSFTIPTGR